MRPWQTIVAIFLVIGAATAFHLWNIRTDPRVEKLSNCFVGLALLHQYADSTEATFSVQKDSVLSSLGLTAQSFQALRSELEREPDKLLDVWDLVEKKLKARKEALDLIKQ
jgi:hypothetical protein